MAEKRMVLVVRWGFHEAEYTSFVLSDIVRVEVMDANAQGGAAVSAGGAAVLPIPEAPIREGDEALGEAGPGECPDTEAIQRLLDLRAASEARRLADLQEYPEPTAEQMAKMSEASWAREDRNAHDIFDVPPPRLPLFGTPPESILRDHRSSIDRTIVGQLADDCARLGRELSRLEARLRSLLGSR